MRESTSHKIVRVYTRREILEALGFEPLTDSKMIVEVNGNDVTVIQQDDSPERGRQVRPGRG